MGLDEYFGVVDGVDISINAHFRVLAGIYIDYRELARVVGAGGMFLF
jgi:hypothetical protein